MTGTGVARPNDRKTGRGYRTLSTYNSILRAIGGIDYYRVVGNAVPCNCIANSFVQQHVSHTY